MAVSDADVRAWFEANPNASDKDIAEAAKAAQVSSEQLSRVTGESKSNVEKRASAVGVNLGSSAGSPVKKTPPKTTPKAKKTPPKAKKTTPPPAQQQVKEPDYSSYSVAQLSQLAQDAGPQVTPDDVADFAIQYNIDPAKLAQVYNVTPESIQQGIDVRKAGGSASTVTYTPIQAEVPPPSDVTPVTTAGGYTYTPEQTTYRANLPADQQEVYDLLHDNAGKSVSEVAKELINNNYSLEQVYGATGVTDPVQKAELENIYNAALSELDQVDRDTVITTDSEGNEVSFDYGSEINNLIAQSYIDAQETGDYSEVNRLLVNSGYTLDDAQKIFGLSDADKSNLERLGITGANPEDSVITDLYKEITDLTNQNQDAQSEIDTLNSIISGLNLTMEDLQNRFTLSEEDVNYIENLGIRGYTPPTSTDGVGSIVTGVPQFGEANIMDYLGLQAAEPTLPTGTELATQIEDLEATDQTLQALTPETTLVTDSQYVATPQEITASTVTSPTPQDAVTATASTTDLVDQPDAAKMTAEKSLEQINEEADALQAARQDLSEIDPKATVQGQLALLQEQFADGEVPVWAQGAFRQVNALMAQRGIGGSTIAAEAITNALMQSALPIAQQDASFYQNVTIQNLSNEQQAEMAKFNARTTAIFNDQAAENAARSLNTQSENELAQFFAQLSQNVALTNTAQTNAMEQFNATAENQATQFFAELGLTAETFNADAINELATFDAEQANIIAQFNANMKNQREQFNVQNQLAIDASNVQWRRDVNTQNTAATNAALQFDAQNLLAVQQTALNNIWQHYDQLLSFAFTAEESAKDRALNLTISSMNAEMQRQISEDSSFLDSITGIVGGAATILGSESGFKLAEKWGLI